MIAILLLSGDHDRTHPPFSRHALYLPLLLGNQSTSNDELCMAGPFQINKLCRIAGEPRMENRSRSEEAEAHSGQTGLAQTAVC